MAKDWAVIGLDAGGTKTFAALATPSGEILETKVSGPGNYQAVGRAFAQRSYREVLGPLVAEAQKRDLRIASVGYGLSGLDRPQDLAVLEDIIPPVHPEGATRILVNDTFVILRAGTLDGLGVAVVSGTGPNTVGWGQDGREERIGGLCSEFGDFGGGGDIGIRALQLAQRGHDGRGVATTLYERIVEAAGIQELTDIADWMLPDSTRPFNAAVFAPVVFEAAEAGDEVALGLLREAGEELGMCARLVAERLFDADAAFPVVLGGSVLQRGSHPVMRDSIIEAVRKSFPGAHRHTLDVQPVAGAILLALDRALGLRGGEALEALSRESLPGGKWPDDAVRVRLGEQLSVKDIVLT